MEDALAVASPGFSAKNHSFDYSTGEIKDNENFNVSERTIFLRLNPSGIQPPRIFLKLIGCSEMHRGHLDAWWKAVATAFFLRPNEQTSALIAKHREDITQRFDQEHEQCISVYVRRGDKHKEMKLIEDERKFFEAARLLWNNLASEYKASAEAGNAAPELGDGKQFQQPVMYFGSEDPDALDSALEWGKANGWKILYSSLFDRRSVDAWRNATEMKDLKQQHEFSHDPQEYFSMILNLDSHIRCSGFVCTQGSNFCRVIDELRATVAGNCSWQSTTPVL